MKIAGSANLEMKLYIGSKDVVVRNRSIYTDTKLYFPMYKMKIITVTNMRPSYSTAYHALPASRSPDARHRSRAAGSMPRSD